MQLRKSVTIPSRYQDEAPVTDRGRNRTNTRPAYPDLLQSQVIPYNPNNPPAAFPSLPLPSKLTSATNADVTDLAMSATFEPLVNSPSMPGAGHSLASKALPESAPNEEPDSRLPSKEGLIQQEKAQARETAWVGNSLARSNSRKGSISAAQSLETPSKSSNNVTWKSLPLSLQYHIYQKMSTMCPTSWIEALGLTQAEAANIEKNAALRAMHPASLLQIWDFCVQATPSIPGHETQGFMDIATFKQYADYMVFAGNFEYAYQPQIRHAEEFLSDRGISTALIGTWLPDREEICGSAYLRHVPSHLFSLPENLEAPRATRSNDSGYSSFSDSEHVVAESTSSQRPRFQDTWPRGAMDPGYPLPSKSSSNLAVRLAPRMNAPESSRNELAKKPPHPLATVTNPPSSAGPAETSPQNAEETDNQPQQQALEVVPRPTASYSHAEDHGRGQYPSLTNTSVPYRRLVLRIQETDGTARIFRKGPPKAFRHNGQVDSQSHFPTLNVPTAETTEIPSNISRKTRPVDHYKRKASESDIHPDPSKAPRTLTDQISESVVPSIEQSKHFSAGTEPKALPGSSTASVPRSPSFSPISENEDLPHFMELLKKTEHRLNAKAPGQRDHDPSNPEFASTRASAAFNAEFIQSLSLTTPVPVESGEKFQKTIIKNNKPQRLRLIVKQPNQAPSQDQSRSLLPHEAPPKIPNEAVDGDRGTATGTLSGGVSTSAPTPVTPLPTSIQRSEKKPEPKTSATPANKERKKRGPYKKTREKMEKERREKEAQ